MAIRSDYRIARSGDDEPIARESFVIVERAPKKASRGEQQRSLSRSRAESSGRRAPVREAHGTQAGYLPGCRTADSCPGGADGMTCRDARNAERRKCARRRGGSARPLSVDAADAAA